MPYDVTITRLADGETRVYHDDAEWIPENDNSSGTWYYWTEGNDGCDCNRALYFKRAANEPEGDDDTPCGDQRLYRIPFVTLPDGQRIQIDE